MGENLFNLEWTIDIQAKEKTQSLLRGLLDQLEDYTSRHTSIRSFSHVCVYRVE